MNFAIIDTENQNERVDPTWLHYKGRMFTGVQEVCDLEGIQCHYMQKEVLTRPPDWTDFAGIVALTNLNDARRRDFWASVPAEVPRVFLGSGMAGNNVESDQEAGMDLLVGHLVEQGFSRIGYFHLSEFPSRYGDKRLQAIKKAFDARGLVPAPGLFHGDHDSKFDTSPDVLFRSFDDFVTRLRPDAIAFSTDDLACRFAGWAARRGLRIPQDVGITGYNDFQRSDWLTTIRYDFSLVGQLAAHALRDILRGRRDPTFDRILLPPLLRVRASSLRASGTEGSFEAIRFRELVERAFLQSPDSPHLASSVSARLELTRPYFLRKFRKLYGREFSSWVSAQRLERAVLFLGSTRRPITEIWMEAGFQSAQHFNRLFKSIHGVTPRAFRTEARFSIHDR